MHIQTRPPFFLFAGAALVTLATPPGAQGPLPLPTLENAALYQAPPAAPPAAPGDDGACSGAPGIADVYLHSGEFHRTEVDLVIRGRGLDFVWSRRYRSRLGRTTAQGNGWDFSYNLAIEPDGSDVRIHDGNGRRDRYRRQTDGTYVAAQLFRSGRFEVDGSFTLTFASGGTWSFAALDGSPAEGKIRTIADRNGNALTFGYDTLGRLEEVIDTLGRTIQVKHDANGRIRTLTDFVGREVIYTYYGAGAAGGGPGDLASVRSPTVNGTPHGNDFPAGKTTSYTYTQGFADDRINHNLLTITDPLGQTWLVNTYAATQNPADLRFDRLVRQQRGDPGDLIDIDYRALPRSAPERVDHAAGATPHLAALVNDRVGNVREYAYDAGARCVSIREFTGRADPDQPTTATTNRPAGRVRADDPPWFVTRFVHNRDALTTRIHHPNGNITDKVHEGDINPMASARSRGNLREIRRTPGSHTPVGDQSVLIERFEYDTSFGGCCGSNFVTKHTDARGNVTQHSYDANGNRLQTIHRIPSIVEDFDYNGFGQLITHVWPDNGSGWRQTDNFTYYGPSAGIQHGYRSAEILDALGSAVTTTWVYDAVGNALQITDARGNVHTKILNELDQEVRSISPPVQTSGATVQYTTDRFYDANDNVVRVDRENIDDLGVPSGSNPHFSTSFEYETLNHLVRRTEEVDLTTDVVVEYGYDANRNRTVERSGEAVCGAEPFNVIHVVHDERDLVFARIRGAGGPYQSTTRYHHSGNRMPARTSEGLEDSPRITTETYDAYDRSIRSTDPMGNVLTRNHDPNGNVVKMQVHGELCDAAGGSNNVLLFEATMTYDAMDRLLTEDALHFDPATGSPIGDGVSRNLYAWTPRSQIASATDDNGNATTYTYDRLNRMAQAIDAAGNSVRQIHDAHDNVIEITEIERPDLIGVPAQVFRTSMAYDALDRQVAAVDALGAEIQSSYDSRDNETTTVDALGNVTLRTFDGLDRLRTSVRILTADGTGGPEVGRITRQWDWDCNSRLIRVTDDNNQQTTYRYDDLDRREGIGLADGTAESCVHDAHGNEVQRVDANGTLVSSTYDHMDRVSTRTITPGPGVSSETTAETWKFDGLSRLVLAQDDDSVVTRTHDSLGNVIIETQNGKVFRRSHDGVGNELSLTYPGGKRVTRTFDALNRIKTIDNAGPTARYDWLGPRRIQLRTTGGGVATSAYVHDGVRRVVSIDHLASTQILDRRSFQWDAQYNRVRTDDLRTGQTQDHFYDSQYRLVRTLVRGATGGTLRDTGYTLDGVGNRLSVTGGSFPGTYTMDPTQPDPADYQMHQYTNTPGIGCLTYDANGNEIGRGSAEVITRNHRNRIVGHQTSSSAMTIYTYDALGRLIGKRDPVSGARTDFYHAGTDVVQERDQTDSIVAEYVRGPQGDVVEMIRGTNRYFFFCDDLGSTRVVTDATGNVVERHEYGDHGEPTFVSPSGASLPGSAIGNTFLFTGKRLEVESGIYDSKARHFDPRTGRFMSRDPIGMWEDALHLGNGRTYAGNNPQTFTDPTGLYTDAVSCSGPFGSRTVTWNRQDCIAWDRNKINNALCPAMKAAEMADFWSERWMTFEATGYPANWMAGLVKVPFLEWFAGPDGMVNGYWRAVIRDTFGDIARPFKNQIPVEIECEYGYGVGNMCSGSNAAYVPHGSEQIHLCAPWKNKGVSRRASILLHEYAHAFGGTDDHFYYWNQLNPTQFRSSWGFPLTNNFETSTLATNADTYQGLLEKWFMK